MTLCDHIVTQRWAVPGSPVRLRPGQSTSRCGPAVASKLRPAGRNLDVAVRVAGAGKVQAMGREFPLQRLPEAVPGAAAVRAPALARVPAWAAVAAGAGVPGAAQAVRVPAGAPAAAGVPAAPAMVWAAATAAVPGAAAAALAAVAAAGPAAALLVRGVPVPAMPVPAGWDRRVRRPHELRERGRDLLPPWDTSQPRGNYPRSGRVRAGGELTVSGGEGLRAPGAALPAAVLLPGARDRDVGAARPWRAGDLRL